MPDPWRNVAAAWHVSGAAAPADVQLVPSAWLSGVGITRNYLQESKTVKDRTESTSENLREDLSHDISRHKQEDFFSCIAGRVRDIVGQQQADTNKKRMFFHQRKESMKE